MMIAIGGNRSSASSKRDDLRAIGRRISSSKCERSHSMEKRAEQVELLERRESCMNSPRCCFFVFRSCGCNLSIILIPSFVSFDRTRTNRNNPPLSDSSV
jgi:hypothetical protein